MRIRDFVASALSPLSLAVVFMGGCSSTNRSEKPAMIETAPATNTPTYTYPETEPTAGRIESESESTAGLPDAGAKRVPHATATDTANTTERYIGTTSDVAATDNSATERTRTADRAVAQESDLELTAKIRRSLMAADGLSVRAQNVHIGVDKGVATLKGSVTSAAEKNKVERLAGAVVGTDKVRSELSVN